MKCPKCQTANTHDSQFCKKCATPLPSDTASFTKTLETPSKALTKGTAFAGRYEIIGLLGKGGMGEVYSALDREVKEQVALKLIRPEIAQDEATIERFRNELKIARRVSHRNICRMHDLGKSEQGYYITMEHVEGRDLKTVIKAKVMLSKEETLSIARQVCEGLVEAHRLGVVHRDLKPQNIMLADDGNTKIMDFGIARSLEAEGMTATGVMVGTPDYISPEQAEGEEADQRSDIYSLGVIMYEMLTGDVPFKGDTALSVALKHKTKLPQDPQKVNPEIPDDLSRLILVCMEKDRERRYQTTEDLLADLQNVKEGLPLGTKIQPARETFLSSLARRKAFAPALVLVLALVAVVIWRLLPERDTAPVSAADNLSLAVLYFEDNTGDESLDNWRRGLSNMVITDLSQSKYLSVLPADRLFQILEDLGQLEAKSYSSDVIQEVASRGEVRHVLKGSYTKAGDLFRINISLQNTQTGDLIGSESVEGRGEESIFSLVDELTPIVKQFLGLSADEIENDFDAYIGQITTRSPEAFKYFNQALEPFLNAQFMTSIQLLERATSIDPEFATAYRYAAYAYGNLGNNAGSVRNFQKAYELRERLPDRDRYGIEAEFYSKSIETADKAIQAYEKLLEFDPDDWGSNNMLGTVYIKLEEWDKAIEHTGVGVENKVEAFYPYYNLTKSYRAKGWYDKAHEVWETYKQDFPDHVEIHFSEGVNYLCQGKFDLALEESNKLFFLTPDSPYSYYLDGFIFLCQGDLKKAEETFDKSIQSGNSVFGGYAQDGLGALFLLQGQFEKSKENVLRAISLWERLEEWEWKSRMHSYIAYVSKKSGEYEKALEQCEKALGTGEAAGKLILQITALHTKGLVLAEMGSIDEAKRVAEELKVLIEKGKAKKLIRHYDHLMGSIELTSDHVSEAIGYFEQALASLPHQSEIDLEYGLRHAPFFESAGLAYFRAEDFDKAQKMFGQITSLTTGRFFFGDIYAKSFYMLGRNHEQMGDSAKAIEHYEQFLDLWKNADPGLPEVEDARKRLAGLRGS